MYILTFFIYLCLFIPVRNVELKNYYVPPVAFVCILAFFVLFVVI